MTKPAKVLMLAPHLLTGGSARITRQLALHLDHKQFEVHLVSVLEGATGSIAGATSYALGASRVRYALPKLLKLVRRIDPELLFSGMAHLNLAVMLLKPCLPKKTKLVLRHNSMPEAVYARGEYSGLDRFLFRRLYPRANRVLCQSQAMADEMERFARVPAHKISVLHNPIDVQWIRAQSDPLPSIWQQQTGPRLVTVARLSQEKGLDLLIEAMVGLRRLFPTAELAIAGSGPAERELKRLCHTLELDETVHFTGELPSPYSLMASASLYVQPSRCDAMPNALLEAAALGLPLAVTPASQGIMDLLAGQAGVWIAQECTVAALTKTLLEALPEIPPLQRFEHDFLRPFHLDKAIAAYEDVLNTLLEERP